MKTIMKSVLTLVTLAFASSVWAASNGAQTISGGGMGSFSDNKHTFIVDAPVYVNPSGNDSANRNERGWYAGVTITWNKKTQKATGSTAAVVDNINAHNVASFKFYDGGWKNSIAGSGLSGFDGSVGGLTDWAMYITTATWYAHMTAEDALTLAGADYTATLTIAGETFKIIIPASVYNAGLFDNDGVKWCPPVATIDGKVYGDLNVAIKTWGTVECVADAAITEKITIAEESTLFLKKGSYTITGFDNLTIMGGKYDFDPTPYLPQGCQAVDNGDGTWSVEVSHMHNWGALSASGDTLSSTCQNSECPITTTYLKLKAVSRDYNGSAFAAGIEKQENFDDAFTNATVGAITYYNTADEEISAPKYTGSYKAKVTVSNGGNDYELEAAFTINKPAGGYSDGWEVNNTSTSVRYDKWEEALEASQDGDTIYYHEGDRTFVSHWFNVGEKNLTIDFGGKKLTSNSTSGMTIGNSGSGTLTLVNVEIYQPKATYCYHATVEGKVVFGDGVKATNRAEDKKNYFTITSKGALVVSNGLYQCGFETKDSGTVLLEGGKYWQHDKPTAVNLVDHLVMEISGDYKYEVVEHTHVIVYTADGNVIKCACEGTDASYCWFNQSANLQTATLTATNATETGSAYAGAKVVYTDVFPNKTQPIKYFIAGGAELQEAPSTFGSYVAKLTVGDATAEASFTIYHQHVFEYDADEENGTITARCTVSEDCDFNVNKRVATLVVKDGTYSGSAQELASVSKNTEDFPGDTEITYYQDEVALDGAPTEAGDYIAKMSVGEVEVEKSFTIAKANMENVTIKLEADTLDFTGEELVNSVNSLKLSEYVLGEGDYELSESSVFSAVGSGYSNETYTITVIGNGNFEGEKTVEWTIRAPEGEFAADALSIYSLFGYGSYGTIEGKVLTVDDSAKLIYAEGSGWFAGVNVAVPYHLDTFRASDSTAEDPEYLRVRLSTMKGTVKGSELPLTTENDVVAATTDEHKPLYGSVTIKYVKTVSWVAKITPAAVEQALADGKDELEYGITVGGLRWKYNSDGLVFTDYTIKVPVAEGFTFALTNNASYDLGELTLVNVRMRMGLGAKVTSTVPQDKPCFIPENEDWSIAESVEGDVYTYTCTEYVAPSVPEEQGKVTVDEENKTVVIEPAEDVHNIDVENGEGYTVEIPPSVDTITGVDDEKNIKIVAEATNETETVKVDITDAFTIEQLMGGGLGITLNPEGEVGIMLGGTCETNSVLPKFGTAEGTEVAESPLVIGADKVSAGVRSIPGLFYQLFFGDDVAGVTNLVKTIEAKSSRVVLEAEKGADPTKFYRVEVVK